jgi:hypothetical protein
MPHENMVVSRLKQRSTAASKALRVLSCSKRSSGTKMNENQSINATTDKQQT